MDVAVNYDWLGVGALVVASVAAILERRHARGLQRQVETLTDQLEKQATEFEMKRNAFVQYLHGRKSHKLTGVELAQVDNQLMMFGPPRYDDGAAAGENGAPAGDNGAGTSKQPENNLHPSIASGVRIQAPTQ